MELTSTLLSPSERERILRAMVELCSERGYEATTVAAVSGRAGVSEEVFAGLFASKEACATDAHAAILSEVLVIVGGSYSPDHSEWESVIFGVQAILEFMAANPSVARMGYVVARQLGPSKLKDSYETGIRAVAAMMDRGRAYSTLRSQPSTTARAALGSAEAIVRREVMAGRAEQLPRLLPDFVYAATVPFLGQVEALRLSRQAQRMLDGQQGGSRGP